MWKIGQYGWVLVWFRLVIVLFALFNIQLHYIIVFKVKVVYIIKIFDIYLVCRLVWFCLIIIHFILFGVQLYYIIVFGVKVVDINKIFDIYSIQHYDISVH